MCAPFEKNDEFRLDSLSALLEGSPTPLSALANGAAYLFDTLPEINWAGFYEKKGKKLVLSAFQGKPACLEIPIGKGVCGTAAKEKRPVCVPDVHAFPGHIACDAASRSEVVVPIRARGGIVAVLDVDSPMPGRFTEADKAGLEQLAAVVERELEELW